MNIPKIFQGRVDLNALRHEIEEQERQLGRQEAHIAHLRSQEAAARANAELGYEAEITRADHLAGEISEAEQQLDAPRGKIANLRAQLTKGEATQAEEEELARLRRIPLLRRACEERAVRIETLAAHLGAELRGLHEERQALAEALQNREAKRVLGIGALDNAARNGLWMHFFLGKGETASQGFRFLAWPHDGIGADAWQSFSRRLACALSVVARWYASREDAEEERDRLDPSRERLHVVRDDRARCFRLVEGRVQGGKTAAGLRAEEQQAAEEKDKP